MNKRPHTRRESGTVTKLAKALGYTPRHTGTLLAKGMPDTLAEARQWLSERENTDTATALRKERIGLVKAQRLAAELANQRAKGELVPRSEVETYFIQTAAALQAMLRRMENELPSLALGLPLSKSAPLMKARIRELQDKLADTESEFWRDHPLA